MDGIIIIDKPAGPTSHDVVSATRRIIRERRIGHTGTLDPFATGVLVLLVGRATRLAQFVTSEKEYEAIIRLGYATDTGDLTGKPIEETRKPPSLTDEEINSAFQSFRGDIDQVPPMYSAKKSQGRKLYELARRGIDIDRPPVKVCIYDFEPIYRDSSLVKDNHDGTKDLKVRVRCSGGTYIRTLAEDFGKRLNSGAHLAELRRTRSGSFGIEIAVTLEQLKENTAEHAIGKVLRPPDSALSHMPFVHLRSDEASRVRNGLDIRVTEPSWPDEARLRLLDEEGNLLGVGYFDEKKHSLHPSVVLSAEK
jgi:tRNA pseudouridine55 synthase